MRFVPALVRIMASLLCIVRPLRFLDLCKKMPPRVPRPPAVGYIPAKRSEPSMTKPVRTTLLRLTFCLVGTASLHAGFSGRELILPAAGRIDGAGGSHFHTKM